MAFQHDGVDTANTSQITTVDNHPSRLFRIINLIIIAYSCRRYINKNMRQLHIKEIIPNNSQNLETNS